MAKYKLNARRDIDTDEPGVYILNLPFGFRFSHDPFCIEHTRAFDSMAEVRQEIKEGWIVPCDCAECMTAA